MQDPNGSTDLLVIQDRMEELKVFIREWKWSILVVVLKLRFVKCFSGTPTEAHAQIQQYGSWAGAT